MATARRHPLVSAAVAYFALRAIDLLAFWLVARQRGQSLREMLLGWDAGWLVDTALNGWPDEIPLGAAGDPVKSTLPWPPVVPLIGRVAATVAGESAAGPALVAANVVGGACAAVLLCLLLLPFVGEGRALGTSIAWSALPATPVLLMGYSEGVFTAFAFAGLWAMTRDRYVLAGLLLLPAGLTKVTVLPFAVTLVLAAIVHRRRSGPAAMPWWRVLSAIALAGVAAVAWPAVVAVRVGAWDAFSASQSAWDRSSIPLHDAAHWLASVVRDPPLNTWIGITVMVAYLAAAVSVARDRTYPVAFRILAVASPVFLLVAGPNLATARQLLPDPALAAALRSWVRGTWTFAVVVGGLVMLGIGWILVFAAAGEGSPPP